MKLLTRQLMNTISPTKGRDALTIGLAAAHGDRSARSRLKAARDTTGMVRGVYGRDPVDAPISSYGETQHKLGLSTTYTMGQTFYHYVFKSLLTGETFQLCPSAGDCVRLCVINNGNGGYDSVQTGWRWRTDMLAHYPEDTLVKLGWEIGRMIMKHGRILDRPDVNSNIEWQRAVPALVDGSVFGDAVTFYGYSKLPQALREPAGWITDHYRVAYSWNESSDLYDTLSFMREGGNVAIVTDRTYNSHTREPISQWFTDAYGDEYRSVDADVSDDWILSENGVVGDLSFKPRTTALREWGATSDFIVKAYHPTAVAVAS